MTTTAPPPGSDVSDENSLLVEEQRFSIVPEWVIDADISDAAFRLYTLLLRYGNGSGHRMPARPTLAKRMHRSVDAVDRAMRQLVAAGMVRVEHRRAGKQYLSNRYHVRTSGPFPSGDPGGGRTSAAAPSSPDVPRSGGRTSAATPGRDTAATPGRTSTARVAADPRPDRETFTQSTNPPPPPPQPAPAGGRSGTAVEVADAELLTACGISDIDELSRRCIAARAALGRPGGRWAPQCLTVAIRMAVVNRGWPPADVVAALLAVAADKATRSPVRLAEAGPWWDTPTPNSDSDVDDVLAEAEARLSDLGGRRVALQAQARGELGREGMPVTRSTVVRRAVQNLDRTEVPA